MFFKKRFLELDDELQSARDRISDLEEKIEALERYLKIHFEEPKPARSIVEILDKPYDGEYKKND